MGGSSGRATLGGRLTAKSVAGFIPLPGNKVTFLTATTNITGQFDQVVGMNLPSSIVPFAIYSPNSVAIGFSPTTPTYVSSYNEVMLTKINQHNVWIGRHMHNLTRRYSGKERFSQMAAFDQDLPLEELVAENDEMEFLAAGEVRHQQERVVDKTRRTNRGGSSCSKKCRTKPSKPWDVYAGPIGSVGEVRNKGSQRGCDYTSVGGLAGFDYAFSSSGVGLLVDYQHIDGDAHKHWGDFDIDELQASFYGVWTPRCIQDLALGLIVGGGYEWYDIHRKTGVPGVSVTAKGDPTGFDVDALVSMEYLFYKSWGSCQRRNIEFAPMVNLQYVYLHVEDYKEDGAEIFDLSVGSQSRNSLRSCLGFRLNTLWESCRSSFRPEINVGWQYEFLDDNDHLNFTPVNVVGITTATTAFGASPNTLLAGLDLLYTHKSGFQLEASYDFEYNDLFVNNEFYLGFGAEF